MAAEEYDDEEAAAAALHVHISDLPDAINVVTYERGKHVLIVDNGQGMASRFLRYRVAA